MPENEKEKRFSKAQIAVFWLVLVLLSGFSFSIGYFYAKSETTAKIVIERCSER